MLKKKNRTCWGLPIVDCQVGSRSGCPRFGAKMALGWGVPNRGTSCPLCAKLAHGVSPVRSEDGFGLGCPWQRDKRPSIVKKFLGVARQVFVFKTRESPVCR